MPRTDRASRVIAAPRDRVYAALVDPDALQVWLPPADMTGRFERFDPRPGGSYRLALTYTDPSASQGKATADTDVVESRFVDLVPGVRVVQAVEFVSDDPAYAGTMTMTWELTETGGGTRVDIVAENVPDGVAAEDHAAGWPLRWGTLPDTSRDKPIANAGSSLPRHSLRNNFTTASGSTCSRKS